MVDVGSSSPARSRTLTHGPGSSDIKRPASGLEDEDIITVEDEVYLRWARSIHAVRFNLLIGHVLSFGGNINIALAAHTTDRLG